MPYIKETDRMRLLDQTLAGCSPLTAGELNYCITRLVTNFAGPSHFSYQTANDVVGALEGAKMEFYRRVVSGYEDLKIQENGDVYKKY